MLNILLEKIKNLPDLSLTTSEYNCLMDILNHKLTSDTQTESLFDTFCRIIERKKNNHELIDIRPEKIEEIRSYLFHFHKLNTILLQWGASIYEESAQVLQKNIGAEEFNDITCALLQKEKFDSQLIQKKIAIALNIVDGEANYYLTALSISIDGKDKALTSEEKKALLKLEPVIKNLEERETALKRLLGTFVDYKNYLLKLMINKLNVTYKKAPRQNDNPIIEQDDNDNQFVEMLRKEIKPENEKGNPQLPGASTDTELINLVEDYQIVKNIYCTLTQEKHSTKQKLECCYQQIKEYKDQLQSNIYFKSSWEILAPYIPGSKSLKQAVQYLHLDKLNSLWPSRQQSFIGTVDKFATVANANTPHQQEEKKNTPTP